jgi:hypothetical protein
MKTSKTFSYTRYSYLRAGKDERYNETSDLDLELLDKIKMYNHKLKVLQRLEDDKVSIFDKIELIENEDIDDFYMRSPNITSGGLFDDWDWDFNKLS